MEAWDDWVVVGRIARAHGNRGAVIINPETDFPENRFAPGRVLYGREGAQVSALRVQTVRFHRGRPIVAFAGVDSMDGAEALAGRELRVPETELSPLPAGTYYQHDLLACRVETEAGEPVGTVRKVEETAGTARLVVAGADGDVEVPLAGDICVVIDPAARRIVIRPPEGLLDLNR